MDLWSVQFAWIGFGAGERLRNHSYILVSIPRFWGRTSGLSYFAPPLLA